MQRHKCESRNKIDMKYIAALRQIEFNNDLCPKNTR